MSTDAQPIALPVTAVTCLEDRALVERTAVLDLRPGVQRLRLGPVSALAVDRSLHAELTGGHPATVLDARIVRAWVPRDPRSSPADDSALRRRVHLLEEEQRDLGRVRDRLLVRLDLLGRLAADLLREIGRSAGSGAVDRPRWTGELDRADTERDTYGEQLRSTEARLATVEVELREARHTLHLAEDKPTELVGHVELTVEAGTAGPVGLRLSHLLPCALWRPAYRAVLDGDSLTLETDAMVWQRTGEDWSDVRLTLSTARSALATEPPRLGEDRLTLRDRSSAERRTVDVELREEEIGDLGPAPVLGLPGVDDAGETRVFRSPAPVSVPGDGRAHRVPLSAFTTPSGTEYACSPELSPWSPRWCGSTTGPGTRCSRAPSTWSAAAVSSAARRWSSRPPGHASSWPSAAVTTTGWSGAPRSPVPPPDCPSARWSPARCACTCPASPPRETTRSGSSSCGNACPSPRSREWRSACVRKGAPPRPTPSTPRASPAGTSRSLPAAGAR